MATNGTGIGYALIERIFGSEVLGYLGYSTAAGSTPVATAMAITAEVALFAVPLVVFYIFTVGLVYSAQHGKVLGTKWNAYIVPLRGAGALMFAAPVVPGGLSAIQIFVVAITLMGNSLGNEAAVQLGDKIYAPGSGFMPVSTSVAGSSAKSQAFASIVATGVCVQAARGLGYGGPSKPASESPAAVLFLENGPGNTSTGLQANTDPLSTICQQGISTTNANPGYPTDQVDCGKTQYPDICNKVQQVNFQYQKKVDDIINANKGMDDKTISDLAYAYQNDMVKAINPDYASIIEKNHQAIKELGWPGLGNYFQRYSEISGEFDNYVYNSANPSFDFKRIGNSTTAGLALHDQTSMAFNKAKNALSMGSDLSLTERATAIGSGVAGGVNSYAASLVNKLDHSVLTTAYRNAIFGIGHSAFDVGAFEATQRMGALQVAMGAIGLEILPTETEIAMRKAGQLSIEQAEPEDKSLESSEGSGVVISFAKKLFQGTSDAMAGVGIYICKALIFTGSALMALLPFLPTMLFDMQTLNWAAMIIVIAIASPLWAVLHMMPDGDDLVNNHSVPGWKYLAYCFLYPTFIVCGFAAAMTLLNVAVPFTFEMMMGHATPSAIGALIDIGLKPIMVSIMVMIEVLGCFAMITKLSIKIADIVGIGVHDDADQNKVTNAIGIQNHGVGGPGSISNATATPLPGAPIPKGKGGISGFFPKVLGKKN